MQSVFEIEMADVFLVVQMKIAEWISLWNSTADVFEKFEIQDQITIVLMSPVFHSRVEQEALVAMLKNLTERPDNRFRLQPKVRKICSVAHFKKSQFNFLNGFLEDFLLKKQVLKY